MRKHQYRGQRVDTKEWVYGFYYQLRRSEEIIVHYIVEYPLPLLYGVKEYEVIPDTVGEFAGLPDKNEKDIYEGDILQTQDPLAMKRGLIEVGFENGMFVGYPNWLKKREGLKLYEWCNECIVGMIACIGNIHDNPELLK